MSHPSQTPKPDDSLALVHAHAAGLDIGSDEIWAAVPADCDPQPVRQFGTFTPDLLALADWLQACGIETVAMESTGVYWIPIFEILEARGLDAQVVNARHLKHVPGRKSDWLDCQWIQRLHSWGLLTGSFRPADDICALRAYLRHRANLIEHRAPHILHMQKALQQMSMMAQPSGCAKSAVEPGRERYHRRDRSSDPPGDGGGGARSAAVGALPPAEL